MSKAISLKHDGKDDGLHQRHGRHCHIEYGGALICYAGTQEPAVFTEEEYVRRCAQGDYNEPPKPVRKAAPKEKHHG